MTKVEAIGSRGQVVAVWFLNNDKEQRGIPEMRREASTDLFRYCSASLSIILHQPQPDQHQWHNIRIVPPCTRKEASTVLRQQVTNHR